ncbi:activating signal cointegrator 1 complex subunit 1 [Histomonas meleagridis]|uniref:activating signal cointegrator 1 complex subunit 1 n=1 Tax=Histomonas meleagridis TaxID=135588 RepID=UPI003559CB26|nr:activating signal cointegrator 1 complex subunit 1 [Histomonas meleagridis]KAH0798956.1 activating signal cointegrator 1 complex subunit 1 [Histomonas meleagridis]
MFQCPGEPDFVLYEVDGMTFRANQGAFGNITFVPDESKELTQIVDVANILAPKVFGKKRVNIQQVRQSTQCKIMISEDYGVSHIIISSSDQECLSNAVAQVQRLIENAKSDEKYTHFIAVDCSTDPAFCQSVRKFLQFVHSSTPLKEDAFDNIARLHLTLAMLKLDTPEEVTKASNVLKDVVGHFKWKGDDKLEIMGINAFSGADTPRVLYAQPKGTDTKLYLKQLQDVLVAKLKENGIDKLEATDIFHITLLRNIWFTSKWGTQAQLQQAFDFKMEPAPLKEIALCERFTAMPGTFYKKPASCELKAIPKK